VSGKIASRSALKRTCIFVVIALRFAVAAQPLAPDHPIFGSLLFIYSNSQFPASTVAQNQEKA